MYYTTGAAAPLTCNMSYTTGGAAQSTCNMYYTTGGAASLTCHMSNLRNCSVKIGIKHGLSCINVSQIPREVLKPSAFGLGFQQLPRDLANVNVLENNV